jgi:hypothetical protein
LDAVKAFDRLERTGGGFLVPLILFCLGMLITIAACLAISQLDQQIREQEQPTPNSTLVEDSRNSLHVIV